MNQLGELGYSTWDTEFGDHSNALERKQQALIISGYYEANLGQLNILLNSNYSLVEGNVTPAMQYEEKAIFNQLYLKDYYKKQSRNILRSASNINQSLTQAAPQETSSLTDWTTLQEGDTVIRRSVATPASKNETARIMSAAANQADEILHKMIHSYNMYGSVPLQVIGTEGSSQMPTIVGTGEATGY
tara:strand:+ start:15443 stop:16006 length:564 start_codon:yes stop_codon:yes gene_type:complete